MTLSPRVPSLFVCLATLLPAPSAEAQESPFTFREIGPGIYASLTVDDVDPSSFANAVAIEGPAGVLLVDTQHSHSAGRALVEALRRHTDRPVTWVVDTHWHGDHVWGNGAVREAWPDAVLLGHPVTRDSLSGAAGHRRITEERDRLEGLLRRIQEAFESGRVPADQTERYEALRARTEAQLEELAGLEVVAPRETVAEQRTLDLGGREVVVFHPGPAHTRGDLVVWVPDTGFLAAGDLLEEAPLWLEGADVVGWSRALDALEALEPTTVLPAHGRLREGPGLLHAHASFLRDAIAAAHRTPPPDSAALVRDLEPHRAALSPWGVEGEAFEAYVAAVREALGLPAGAPRPEGPGGR
ncbi:MAG TPA: MBL fold metallo-hydrolase [Longimicrobiales bacterium]|nr:MBL fold metallo-hydrolase [Longimicrobiales bacterium]